jgi:lysine 2,3-aminomutase
MFLQPVQSILRSSLAVRHHDDQSRRKVKYLRSIDQVPQLSNDGRSELKIVTQKYAFRANDYYLRLINWDDPNDPIRQLVIPQAAELTEWGKLDASNEGSVTVDQGVQHKYRDTVLLICNEVCGAYCRYCFRKRLFMDGNDKTTVNLDRGLEYIASHPEVSNVLLTGGDPLIMSTRRLVELFRALREIPHVRIIRVGSKMPAFNPHRITEDPQLLDAFAEFSGPQKRVYLMAHFDHPRELTTEAVAAINACIRNGVICVNQCPLVRGINDDPNVLRELYSRLSFIGCTPYYLFQGRPTAGNLPYAVTLVNGFEIFQNAITGGSGLARRARYCMSHESGKVEILGIDQRYIYLRYHQAKDPADAGRFFRCHRDDNAYWLDDLERIEE